MKKITMKRRKIAVLLIIAILSFAGLAFLSQFNLSALEEPGEVETFVATKGKHFLVGRSARTGIPSAPLHDFEGKRIGHALFVAQCASCHGGDGRTPTELGRSLYPPAPDLGSSVVQQYSDEELFWVIKNGIRLTGMPGFGNMHPDEHILHLAHVVRNLQEENESRN